MARAFDCLSGLLMVAAAGVATVLAVASLKAAQAEKSSEVATRGQRDASDISYGSWQKLCFKAGGAPSLCRTSITGRFATGQTAVRIDLIEREDAPTARLQLFVPVGMYLQQAPKLAVDHGAAFRIPYTWCLTNLCVAADVVTPKIISEMENGQTLLLELVDSNLLAVTTSIPLAQFGSAHKGAPTRTLEQYVDE
ncbi:MULTISPECIES: invasion associated locus B family protein [unclassified Bradyrhizobium]|uniref:invasion associated locus B family protein n=1 Tax=unclassified Bradyrhizobium TaxID=2631580 RepID=UPI001CD5B210|nr:MULTISPECIES: invasion associated locus B family protein [unclassified Bradyrhizobium]MCA1372104.1 invasion associated locus B family protein [Bradyrhizobium sp. IC4060]MCA1474697.1 invasion associated locus B family protein [Bradyrhizobium sp. NBAIM08]MCA1486964.1 invasion associated locus B family protein [Bradyrhizobium sp. IC4061]